jgi:hypothetical protein
MKGANMANSIIDLYGFLSDTAFMNREFSDPGSANSVDQGAYCYTDSVQNMFGNVGYVKDPRDSRISLPTISPIDPDWTADSTGVRNAVLDPNEKLNGKMCLVVNNSIDDSSTIAGAFASESVKRLFEFLEIAFNFQVFKDSIVRSIDNTALRALLDTYSDVISSYKVSDEVVDISKSYYLGAQSNRMVRSWVSCTWRPTSDTVINLKVWAGRQAFKKDFPVSTITDIIFPCQCDKLYDLVTEYASMTDFASKVSDSTGSIYSMTARTYVDRDINDLLAADDHTGVYKFRTNYYANPDVPDAKTFELTFGVVYKGAKPTLDLVRDAIRTAILQIDSHSEAQWIKKLPGIISGRAFYMIPLFDEDGNVIRKGIIDTTTIASLVERHLGETVASVAESAQVVTYENVNYAVIVVPSPGNPLTTRLLSNVYPDFMGVPSTVSCFDHQTDNTQDFSINCMNALNKAYRNEDASALSADDIPTDRRFVAFTSLDGINFYVMTRHSVVG